MGAMTISFVASLITALAGLLAMACLTPKRHLGRGDSWISFAAGALAGMALLEVLPRAWQVIDSAQGVLSLTLLGAACCFSLDRHFRCRRATHAHGENCYLTKVDPKGPSRRRPGQILLVGDLFHSVVDGSLIAGAFMMSLPFGVLVTAAIVVHEIPRKCATMLILVHAGCSRARALLLGSVSSLGVLVGAVMTWESLSSVNSASPVLLLGAAAIMLYVAIVEVMPFLRSRDHEFMSFKHAGFMLLGLICVGGTHFLLEPVV